MAVLDGDILRVSVNFELGDGTQYQNIYHFIRDGSDPYSDAIHVTAIADKMAAAYLTIKDLVTSDVTAQLSFVDRIEFNEIVDEWRVVENIGTFTTTFNPTESIDALPYQSAPFLVFKTQRPKSVGKKFLFPFSEAQQADTVLVGGAVTAMVAYGVQVLAAIELGGDATLTAGIVRTGVQTFLNFLVATVNDIIGSQKRR
ncbi:unnamed protein product, partial [marine sediment metagenome]